MREKKTYLNNYGRSVLMLLPRGGGPDLSSPNDKVGHRILARKILGRASPIERRLDSKTSTYSILLKICLINCLTSE